MMLCKMELVALTSVTENHTGVLTVVSEIDVHARLSAKKKSKKSKIHVHSFHCLYSLEGAYMSLALRLKAHGKLNQQNRPSFSAGKR